MPSERSGIDGGQVGELKALNDATRLELLEAQGLLQAAQVGFDRYPMLARAVRTATEAATGRVSGGMFRPRLLTATSTLLCMHSGRMKQPAPLSWPMKLRRR